MAEQPRWRRDFAIDSPQDHHVARHDFTDSSSDQRRVRCGSGVDRSADLVGIVARRRRRKRKRIAAMTRRAPSGESLMFDYPGEHDPVC